MTLTKLTPAEARARIAAGATLIDIRAADEHARSRIPGAVNAPLGSELSLGDAPAVIFHCRSGMRTDANAGRLAAASPCEAYLLEGGIDAWKAAGLPLITDAKAPLEIMRQVQITAGLLVLTGVILSLLVAPAWIALSGFVGAGLTFAGATGWCGMARLLSLMPWNRNAVD
jgi:rhodanese-related sulfurtransferase